MQNQSALHERNTHGVTMLWTSGGWWCLIEECRWRGITRNRMMHLCVTETVITSIKVPLFLAVVVKNEAFLLVRMDSPGPRVLIESRILLINWRNPIGAVSRSSLWHFRWFFGSLLLFFCFFSFWLAYLEAVDCNESPWEIVGNPQRPFR